LNRQTGAYEPEPMKETARLFIAFELPDRVLALAKDLQARLKRHGLKMQWVRPQNMHLTVKFLGEVSQARIGDVSAALHHAALEAAPMEVCAQGLGVFPGMRQPRVLWFGLGGQVDLLGEACQHLEDALDVKGFARERRPFRPHLTLARIKQAVDPTLLLEGIQTVGRYDPVGFRLTEWVLFQSDLRSQGAIYTALDRAMLAQGA